MTKITKIVSYLLDLDEAFDHNFWEFFRRLDAARNLVENRDRLACHPKNKLRNKYDIFGSK